MMVVTRFVPAGNEHVSFPGDIHVQSRIRVIASHVVHRRVSVCPHMSHRYR